MKNLCSTRPLGQWVLLSAIFVFCITTILEAQNTFPATGNVGIGTASPIRALHVNGELSVTRADKTAYINVSDPSGNGGGSIILRGLNAAGSAQVPASISLVGNTTIYGGILGNAENAALGIDNIGDSRLGFIKKPGSVPVLASSSGSPIVFGQTNQSGIFTNIGGSTLTERMRIASDGNVGIGTTNPGAKFEVHNSAPLATTAGSFQLLSRTSGRGDNYFMSNLWLRRDANGFEWWTTTLHDGISIDGSFLTPGVDTRTWWERHPQSDKQAWGHANQTYMTLHAGNLGIGTASPDAKLAVKGTVHANEVKVDLNVPGPDYVFANNYQLLTINELKTYIDQNKHLPEVPSAAVMEANGINLGEMNMLLLKKIEELTLYVIELKKRDEDQQKEIEVLKKQK